jgi:transcriptional antiterminator NusG
VDGASTVMSEMQWYVVRVQSGKEELVQTNLARRVNEAGLEDKIGRVLVLSEKVSEIRSGSKRVTEKKSYPGYIFIEMILEDDSWFLVRETPGIGDFVGPQMQPIPLGVDEVEKLILEADKVEEKPKLQINFQVGDGVKIKEGPFQNFDGVVEEVIPDKGLVKVVVTIFGRATPVELEYWQVETL